MGLANSRYRFLCDFRSWFIVALSGLVVAYFPYGVVLVGKGFAYSWDLLIHEQTVASKFWSLWLFVAVILGNVQIGLCLASIHRPHPWYQNQLLKVVAWLGQLSWGIFGHEYYSWYFWVVSSAILFWATPRPNFEARWRGRKRDICIPHSLLRKLESTAKTESGTRRSRKVFQESSQNEKSH